MNDNSQLYLLAFNIVSMIVCLICGANVRRNGYIVAERARQLDNIERWLDERERKIEYILETRDILM